MRAIWDQMWLAVQAGGRIMRHPRHQALILAVVLYLAVGVGFYSWQEGWSIADSFYFGVVALTTVGFGDLAPTTTFTKLFTAVYLMVGLGILGTAAHAVVQSASGRLPTRGREPGASD